MFRNEKDRMDFKQRGIFESIMNYFGFYVVKKITCNRPYPSNGKHFAEPGFIEYVGGESYMAKCEDCSSHYYWPTLRVHGQIKSKEGYEKYFLTTREDIDEMFRRIEDNKRKGIE